MGARTGPEFLRGIRDAREVWVDGERVRDVVDHPVFGGAAHTLAELFDLQHAHAQMCLIPDPETGEPINASHMIPRSRADLERRHACLQRIAEHSVGLMGRSPDYMNVTFAGFAGRHDEWGACGNEAGAANLVGFQKRLRRQDLALTHTIIHPTVDKSRPDVAAGGGEIALHKVRETAHGIVVRGARILATLAPFADELAVYPGHPVPPDGERYALAFSIPLSTPGLKFLCRESVSRGTSRFDDLAVYNLVLSTSWFPNGQPLAQLRHFLPTWFPRVNEILRLIGSHNLLATPTESQLRDPDLGPLIATYLQGASGTSAETRIRVFRLAWDFAASALASRNEQYERFYLASGARNRVLSHLFAPKERSARLVERFLEEEPD